MEVTDPAFWETLKEQFNKWDDKEKGLDDYHRLHASASLSTILNDNHLDY